MKELLKRLGIVIGALIAIFILVPAVLLGEIYVLTTFTTFALILKWIVFTVLGILIAFVLVVLFNWVFIQPLRKNK